VPDVPAPALQVEADTCPTPVCADYTMYLTQCTINNALSPGVKAYSLDISFTGGSDTPTNIPTTVPPGWDGVLAQLRQCPTPPQPAPGCGVAPPPEVAGAQGHSINIVCKNPDPGSFCATNGMYDCILYEPQAGGFFITSPYCSTYGGPLNGSSGTGPYPPGGEPYATEMANVYGWTNITFSYVYTVRNPVSCQLATPTPDQVQLPPSSQCTTQTGYAQTCCSSCERAGADGFSSIAAILPTCTCTWNRCAGISNGTEQSCCNQCSTAHAGGYQYAPWSFGPTCTCVF
jgi:hypothetical protein